MIITHSGQFWPIGQNKPGLSFGQRFFYYTPLSSGQLIDTNGFIGYRNVMCEEVVLIEPKPMVVGALEAARLLGVSHGTVINLYKSGRLPSVQIGRRVLIRLSDLEAYLERNLRRYPAAQEVSA